MSPGCGGFGQILPVQRTDRQAESAPDTVEVILLGRNLQRRRKCWIGQRVILRKLAKPESLYRKPAVSYNYDKKLLFLSGFCQRCDEIDIALELTLSCRFHAGVMKLVDVPDSKSGEG